MFNTNQEKINRHRIELDIYTAANSIHHKKFILGDITILLLMGLLFFWSTSTQLSNKYSDMTRYQCYAIAFWQGQTGLQAHGLEAAPTSQCAFLLAESPGSLATRLSQHHLPAGLTKWLASQSSTQPFHILPPEYPFLTLIPFSLALLVPFAWYQIAFAILMICIAGVVYALLVKYQSRSAALVFALYLVVGSWATASDRFDIIPAALTLGAVILAGKTRWKWAFALLALATLCKFYPLLLVLPFLIAQQMQYRTQKWYAWRRWSALSVFVGLGILVTAVSFFFSVANTLQPITYFLNRPLEVEAFPADFIWLSSLLGNPTGYNMAYQSLNYVSSLEHYISPLSTLLEIAGLLCTCWLLWRNKIDIYAASLLTILVILVTGKVFSPQYLIWAAPLVALVGKANWKWVLCWGLVCALTTFMFPFHYNSLQQIQQFYAVYFLRNLLIFSMTGSLLYWYSKRTTLVASVQATTRQQDLGEKLANELE